MCVRMRAHVLVSECVHLCTVACFSAPCTVLLSPPLPPHASVQVKARLETHNSNVASVLHMYKDQLVEVRADRQMHVQGSAGGGES